MLCHMKCCMWYCIYYDIVISLHYCVEDDTISITITDVIIIINIIITSLSLLSNIILHCFLYHLFSCLVSITLPNFVSLLVVLSYVLNYQYIVIHFIFSLSLSMLYSLERQPLRWSIPKITRDCVNNSYCFLSMYSREFLLRLLLLLVG